MTWEHLRGHDTGFRFRDLGGDAALRGGATRVRIRTDRLDTLARPPGDVVGRPLAAPPREAE